MILATPAVSEDSHVQCYVVMFIIIFIIIVVVVVIKETFSFFGAGAGDGEDHIKRYSVVQYCRTIRTVEL